MTALALSLNKTFFHLLHTPPVVLWRRNQLVTGTSQEMMPKSVNGISFCSLVSCLAVYTIWPRHRSAILTSGNQKLICKPDLDKKVHLSEYFKNRCLIQKLTQIILIEYLSFFLNRNHNIDDIGIHCHINKYLRYFHSALFPDLCFLSLPHLSQILGLTKKGK